jgi:hypothetical protein
MIVFDLKCARGHYFEGWFEDNHAYENQKANALITCPVCNETSVSKIPSTFGIKSSSPSKRAPSENEMAELAEKIGEFVEKNFEDVGCDFTREALKIHYGASEPRNIRGVSSPDEEKTLKEEGIPFFKLPTKPPVKTNS